MPQISKRSCHIPALFSLYHPYQQLSHVLQCLIVGNAQPIRSLSPVQNDLNCFLKLFIVIPSLDQLVFPQVFMGNGLFAGNMGSLRGNSFIFSRSVRLSGSRCHFLSVVCGVNLLKTKVSSLADINPLQIISQPILHPFSRPIDKSRQLQ